MSVGYTRSLSKSGKISAKYFLNTSGFDFKSIDDTAPFSFSFTLINTSLKGTSPLSVKIAISPNDITLS